MGDLREAAEGDCDDAFRYVSTIGLEERDKAGVAYVVDGSVDLGSFLSGSCVFASEQGVEQLRLDSLGFVEHVDVAGMVLVRDVGAVEENVGAAGFPEHHEGCEETAGEHSSMGVGGEAVFNFVPGSGVSTRWQVAGRFDELREHAYKSVRNTRRSVKQVVRAADLPRTCDCITVIRVEEPPRSIRMSDELVQRIDQHIGVRGVLGEKVSRSDIVREALEAYLPAFDDELRAIVSSRQPRDRAR